METRRICKTNKGRWIREAEVMVDDRKVMVAIGENKRENSRVE